MLKDRRKPWQRDIQTPWLRFSRDGTMCQETAREQRHANSRWSSASSPVAYAYALGLTLQEAEARIAAHTAIMEAA